MEDQEPTTERGWRIAEEAGGGAPVADAVDYGAAGGGTPNTQQGGTGSFPTDGDGKKPSTPGTPPAAREGA